MSEHLSQDDLGRYVIDALDEARSGEVEAHAVACEACRAALAREAALEIAFEQLARAPGASAPEQATRMAAIPLRRASVAVVTAGALSLAAGWMLFLSPMTQGSPHASASRVSNPVHGHGTRRDDATAALDGSSADPLDGG